MGWGVYPQGLSYSHFCEASPAIDDAHSNSDHVESDQPENEGIENGHSEPAEVTSPVRPVIERSYFESLLRLMRIPNVFTAIADVLMGFVFIHQSFQPVGGLICLVGATICLYSGGMILNDVFDIEVDRKERPERPIPSGAIPYLHAQLWGFGLLLSGLFLSILAFLISPAPQETAFFGFESGCVAIFLIVAILLYNKVLKKTPIAPLAMGSCRFFNILLGMSLLGAEQTDLIPAGLVIAGGMGLYVAGFTWFARSEAKSSDQRVLGFGLVVMLIGLVSIASVPFLGLTLPPTVIQTKQWLLPFFIVLFGISVVRLSLYAIMEPTPRNVQIAVKQCILQLILINAGLTLWIHSQEIQLALVVSILYFPAILLGRWFQST